MPASSRWRDTNARSVRILEPELARLGRVDDVHGDVAAEVDPGQLLAGDVEHRLVEEHLAAVVQGQTMEPGDDAEAVARELLDGIPIDCLRDDSVDVTDLDPVREERELDVLAEGRPRLERGLTGDEDLHVEDEGFGYRLATPHLADLHRAAVEARRR